MEVHTSTFGSTMGAFSSTLTGRNGGERFDMSQPESYLFGENSDLNFLGSKPVPFPYPAGGTSEPTKTLKSLVNIRKDTLRLVRIPEVEKLQPEDDNETLNNKYNIEFVFDSDVKCSIKVMLFCTEEIVNGQISYSTREPALSSETFHYKRGASQVFQQSGYVLDPSTFSEEELQYNPDGEEIPVVIQCIAEDDESSLHAHMTFAMIEKSSLEGGYVIKPLKQKQFIHGLCYLLQEIYGIENKNNDKVKDDDGEEDELEDSGAECVICMSDMRDTLILPCRHLCLCSTCAESLRYQASNCPICRSPFRALLQIRAMRKKQAPLPLQQGGEGEEVPVNQEGVPAGYEAVSLIEALNGPCGLPPPNTMEGIHVPPPRVLGDIESRHKHRSSKKRNTTVETVKELKMSEDDKKASAEEKDGERTDTSVKTESSAPLTDSQQTPTQKQINSSARIRKQESEEGTGLPRSPSSDHEVPVDSLHVVNEHLQHVEPVREVKKLVSGYPTISSENLADDEREDTSEGEPEPDYEQEECSLEDRLDSIASGGDLTEDISESAFVPPPDYASVMNEEDTDPDTDELMAAPVPLRLSKSPPSSSDSASSRHSSQNLLEHHERTDL
ncbi:RN157-like protein [Mya arenaria]|uniref:RING-type E3 ubiquitin transferase n=1 Tax=Mya arenaria TaxID=6604 RepID=A0ABY7DJG5_MYAAR|nr:RN157-like protein [Mya arenaria]